MTAASAGTASRSAHEGGPQGEAGQTAAVRNTDSAQGADGAATAEPATGPATGPAAAGSDAGSEATGSAARQPEPERDDRSERDDQPDRDAQPDRDEEETAALSDSAVAAPEGAPADAPTEAAVGADADPVTEATADPVEQTKIATDAAVALRRNVLLEPGAVVGEDPGSRWKVLRHVADGGFSSVYQVRPATPETRRRHGPQRRALKCLWGTPSELTQIGGEAGKMAAVDGHGNVLGLVTSLRFEQQSTFSRSHYVGLVLELAGEDLYQFRDRAGIPERAWAAIFEQLAAGLEHIHARRIVHGDIKPTNLLRVGPAFKIADFGLSAQLETTRSAGIGLARTIAFWPPESGSQGVLGDDGIRRPPVEGWRASQLGDVWALAVSMHRILTGRHITTGMTPEQQYELVCAGRITVDDRLSPGWRKLLSDCLVHDRDARVITTAADLRRRLAELALPEEYLSVPWSDGEPRVVALVDGVEEERTLLLYMTQEGGRVHGTFVPRGDVLLDVARHVHAAVVPSLGQQVRDSQRAAVRLAEEQERLREQAARMAATGAGAGPAADANTAILRETERERTRQLSVAVAEVTRQRDQAARDRDQQARRADALVAERDRLARQYADLARRLDRLELARPNERVAPQVVHVPVAAAPGQVVHPGQLVQPVPAARRRGGHRVIASLFWALVVLALALAVGTMAASQILYEDPFEIFSWIADAFSERVRGN